MVNDSYVELLEFVNNALCHPNPFFIGMDESALKEGYILAAYYTKNRDLVKIKKFDKQQRRKSLKFNDSKKIVKYLKNIKDFKYCEFMDDGLKEDNLFSKWRVFSSLAFKIINNHNHGCNENCFVLIDGNPPSNWSKRRLSEAVCYTLFRYSKKNHEKNSFIGYKEFQKHILYIPQGDSLLESILIADTIANGLTNLGNEIDYRKISFIKKRGIKPMHVGLVE